MERLSVILAILAIVGFFETTIGNPASRAVKDLPIEDVIFQLYTREGSKRVTVGDASSLDGTGFNPELPTKVIVHGWMDELSAGTIQGAKDAFLALEPMNVFGVDWSVCSHMLLYEKAIECSKQVGVYIGDLVIWLGEATGLPPSNVHGVGHSLGAHVIASTSQVLKLGRITALDAAGPLFLHVKQDSRVDPTDADFIDAIHTSGLAGLKSTYGHADFYPNGGSKQPGCDDLLGSCAHGAANHFFAHSIAHTSEYQAFKCDSVEQAQNQSCTGEPKVVMGYGATSEHRGIFYLKTLEVPNKL